MQTIYFKFKILKITNFYFFISSFICLATLYMYNIIKGLQMNKNVFVLRHNCGVYS